MGKRFGHAIKRELIEKPSLEEGSEHWIFDHLDSPKWHNKRMPHDKEVWTISQPQTGLCVICKGSRRLCGKTRCPVIVRANLFMQSAPMINSLNIDGASPPSVFVGRIGYPYVYAGPMVPPLHEDTTLYDLPELWFGKTIDEIVGFRSLLIRGKHRVHVQRFEEAGKVMDFTRELALASAATDVELSLKKRPRGSLVVSDTVQPFGPSAPIRDLRVDSPRWDHQIEKVYYDTDLKAKSAVLELYCKNVMVTKIQKAFSVGAFGIKSQRRLVPTRWSITAVDSLISKELAERIKAFPLIEEYRLYESSYLDNQFEILMIPDAWSYEAIEAWYPGTVWNQNGRSVMMYGDWEGFEGRTRYAKIGGCYYSARLAVCELLMKERRQATVLVLREARPGYIMPVGVWQVRENVRNAMRQKPLKYDTLDKALQRISTTFQIPIVYWKNLSKLIRSAKTQRKMTQYI